MIGNRFSVPGSGGGTISSALIRGWQGMMISTILARRRKTPERRARHQQQRDKSNAADECDVRRDRRGVAPRFLIEAHVHAQFLAALIKTMRPQGGDAGAGRAGAVFPTQAPDRVDAGREEIASP